MFIRIDKSYGNLLTAIDWCLRRQVKPEAFLTEYDCPLISDCLAFETKENISARIRNKLKEIIPASVAGRIMSTAWLAWLSEESAMATYIFEYFFKAFESGNDPTDRVDFPAAVAVSTAAKKTARMAHSYKGILRFHQTVDRNNIFYLAEIEPDCNILPLIAGHFSDRFADQNFVIIDRRRQLLFTHKEDGGFSLRWFASKEIIPDNLSVSDDFDSYWMNYLKHLAIPERANSSLQKSRLPLKYRKHMTEF